MPPFPTGVDDDEEVRDLGASSYSGETTATKANEICNKSTFNGLGDGDETDKPDDARGEDGSEDVTSQGGIQQEAHATDSQAHQTLVDSKQRHLGTLSVRFSASNLLYVLTCYS